MTSPKITDAQVQRALTAFVNNYEAPDEQMRKALEAALDRRTGPKCRRVEYAHHPGLRRKHGPLTGRRSTDTVPYTDLPIRLARESAEKSKRASPEEEIPAKEPRWMTQIWDLTRRVYALETKGRKELEAAPSGASCAAKTESGARAETTTGDGVRWVQTSCRQVGPHQFEISGYYDTPRRRKTDAE